LSAFDIERDFHSDAAAANGFRYAATFQISLSGEGYTKILVNVLWNANKNLVKGTTNTETVITDAGLSILPSGIGWAEVNDIPGEDAWVDYSKRIIRFSKRFALKLAIAPAVSAIPKIGDALKDLGATNNWRVEAEGYLDVVTYKGDIKVTIY